MTGHEVHTVVSGIVCAAVLGAVYMCSCLMFPKTRCWRCRDAPSRTMSSSRKNWRDCWWCGGTGWRLRYGKRIYDRWAKGKR